MSRDPHRKDSINTNQKRNDIRFVTKGKTLYIGHSCNSYHILVVDESPILGHGDYEMETVFRYWCVIYSLVYLNRDKIREED